MRGSEARRELGGRDGHGEGRAEGDARQRPPRQWSHCDGFPARAGRRMRALGQEDEKKAEIHNTEATDKEWMRKIIIHSWLSAEIIIWHDIILSSALAEKFPAIYDSSSTLSFYTIFFTGCGGSSASSSASLPCHINPHTTHNCQ